MNIHHFPRGIMCCSALVILAMVFPLGLGAQFRTVRQPQSYGTASLRGITLGTVIPELTYGEGRAWDTWSSSFLRASGPIPPVPAKTGNEDTDMENEFGYSSTLASYNTMYSARSLMDGDVTTGWSEGVPGAGIGEVVIVRIPSIQNMGIMTGFQRTPALYAKNARPRQVRLWLMAAQRMDFGQFDDMYASIKVLASVETELKDSMGWQALTLPQVNAPVTQAPGMDATSLGTKWFLAVQILSVYPGSTWQDTCITEIGPLP